MNLMRWLVLAISCAALQGCSEGHVIYGQVQQDRLLLTATANELIYQVAVQKGQRVKVGDLLVQLDPQTQQQRLLQAQAELQQRQAALELLQLGARAEQRAAAAARQCQRPIGRCAATVSPCPAAQSTELVSRG